MALSDRPYRACFITLPTNEKRFDGVILGIMRKGRFLLDLADVQCFYEVVYGVEHPRRDTAERFAMLKPFFAACVETVYIDCHWIGYVTVTTSSDGSWKLMPMYGNGLCRSRPFDFGTFRKEIRVHLEGWTNLKRVVLFAPRPKRAFLSALYAETKRVVTDFKDTLPNPHHVRVVEVLNDGVDGIEYTQKALAFYENARA